MTRDPDTLPTYDDLSGRCSRCGRVSNFKVVRNEPPHIEDNPHQPTPLYSGGDPTVRPWTVIEQATVSECMGCNERSVVIEATVEDQLIGVLGWPTEHLADLEPGTSVPQDVIDAYSEGVRCLGVRAPNAAAAMFRTTIAHIVMDKGSAAAGAARDLNAKINQMAHDGALWNDFGDAAHYIRKVGNAGAHGEAFDPLTMEQATDLQRFIRALIDFIYVQPFKLASTLAPTRRTTTGSTPPTGAGGSGP